MILSLRNGDRLLLRVPFPRSLPDMWRGDRAPVTAR